MPAEPRRSALGQFVHRYGWRAYSIPILIALTVLVVLQVGRTATALPVAVGTSAQVPGAAVVATTAGTTAARAPATTAAPASAVPPVVVATSSPAGPSTASAVTPAVAAGAPSMARTTPAVPSSTPAVAAAAPGLATAALPAGDPFVAQGKGTWHVVKGTSPVLGSGGTKYTFSIEVEDGVENAAADQQFATLVDAALADPRSWIGSGNFQLQRVDSGTPSFRISLTSQLTVRSNTLCGWEIHYEASCYARGVKRVAINDARWTRGAMSFHGDLAAYRVYAINHEVGHALGFVHRPCPTTGGPAPVMMQQSWSTADNDLSPLNPQLIPMDGKVCTFNPYPYPAGAAAVVSPAGG